MLKNEYTENKIRLSCFELLLFLLVFFSQPILFIFRNTPIKKNVRKLPRTCIQPTHELCLSRRRQKFAPFSSISSRTSPSEHARMWSPETPTTHARKSTQAHAQNSTATEGENAP
uniref:(northern house mosquito) hypothetical protein n=1 Tax=Culex pipiens TaxID=7175 RepID=A0A8D8FYX6_CULPI